MRIKATIFIVIGLFLAACAAPEKAEVKFEPKKIIKEYIEALKAKDLKKVKEVSSAKTIELLEEAAKQKDMSLEDMIKQNEPDIKPILVDPEIRNEKVDGDRATVEIKNPDDESWSELSFVKEDGRWKIGATEVSFAPKDIISEYVEALKAKDPAKIKAVSSAETISVLEEAAKQKDMSLEDMIKQNEPKIQPLFVNPEIRNEKVVGDRAMVEIKNPDDGNWSELLFVKEDGRWKIGVGETFKAAQKQKSEKDGDKKNESDKKEDPEKKEEK